MANKFNILYLHAHDAGRYVEPYGFPVQTPNLMKFAKEGVLFRKAFVLPQPVDLVVQPCCLGNTP